jgi:hypothetical protein
MCAIVFRQIKLRSCPKIIWYILVILILKVGILIPLEIHVDVSAARVLNFVVSVSLELHLDVSIPLVLIRMFQYL